MRSRIVSPLFAVCLALLLASCGNAADPGEAAAGANPTPATSSDEGQVEAETEEKDEEGFSCLESRGDVDATIKAVDNPDGVEFDWKPANVEIRAGKEVVLKVVNRSYADHDFSAGDCYSGMIGPKEAIKVAFVMPDHPVPFYCGLHPQGMAGKLVPR